MEVILNPYHSKEVELSNGMNYSTGQDYNKLKS